VPAKKTVTKLASLQTVALLHDFGNAAGFGFQVLADKRRQHIRVTCTMSLDSSRAPQCQTYLKHQPAGIHCTYASRSKGYNELAAIGSRADRLRTVFLTQLFR
jgi:hypothetical protein